MFNFRHVWKLLGLGLTLLLVDGCAAMGDRFSDMAQVQKPPAPGMARIFIYRNSSMDAAFAQPMIDVNGQVLGKGLVDGFFFVDEPAGNYKISAPSGNFKISDDGDADSTLNLAVEAGQVRYVRLDFKLSFLNTHAVPTLVDAAEGSKDIQNCHYLGKTSQPHSGGW